MKSTLTSKVFEMAIESATQAEIQTARDEVFKVAVMFQKFTQSEGDQAGTLAVVNAQISAANAAIDAVIAAV